MKRNKPTKNKQNKTTKHKAQNPQMRMFAAKRKDPICFFYEIDVVIALVNENSKSNTLVIWFLYKVLKVHVVVYSEVYIVHII